MPLKRFMASVIATKKLKPASSASELPSAEQPSRRARRWSFISPLTLRILAINAIAPALFLASFLYLDYYREGLIEARLESLMVQGQLIAGALGEAAISEPSEIPSLGSDTARQLVRRLATATDTRARLFGEGGELIADSRNLIAAGRDVISRPLSPLAAPPFGQRAFNWLTRNLRILLPVARSLPPYRERIDQRAEDYPEVVDALSGEVAHEVRAASTGLIILTVAVPVQSLRKILGALMLSAEGKDIEDRVQLERLNVLKLFFAVLALTVLLSIFLASTIARPVRKLAMAADMVRRAHGRGTPIPDFGDRRDEIGDLSVSLREMTDSLYRRIDAIEAFAADVSHEIKNPLTSLRSAIETLARTKNPEQQQRLLDILQQDVKRLDRLISDISNASRLDAELSRTESGVVDVAKMLSALVEVHRDLAKTDQPEIILHLPRAYSLTVPGMESRLGQVVRNLLDNAISFSPPGGKIWLGAQRAGKVLKITVADEGTGIPEDKLDAIFDRFYSARPEGEKFGQHSGLGLSISQQIVQAHRGHIMAQNRRDDKGRIIGALFTVELPLRG